MTCPYSSYVGGISFLRLPYGGMSYLGSKNTPSKLKLMIPADFSPKNSSHFAAGDIGFDDPSCGYQNVIGGYDMHIYIFNTMLKKCQQVLHNCMMFPQE